REQGITIDVAYRYFETERRRFILADTPGHEQYTRNMITGASTADIAVLLVDARKGLLPQTRRHATIAALLGIRQVIVAVNKMDLVGFKQDVFDAITADFSELAAKLGGLRVTAIPVCAIAGDNVIHASQRLHWYNGPTLLAALEAAEPRPAPVLQPFRLPVQFVSRSNGHFRGYAGTVSSGTIRTGAELINVQSRIGAVVERIVSADGDLAEAGPGDAVMLALDREIDVSRGDVLASGKLPDVADQLVAQVAWFGETPLYRGRTYLMALGGRTVTATVSRIDHRTDIDTLADVPASELHGNDIGRVGLSLSQPLVFEPYAQNRDLGGFILIDRLTRNTLGAGLVERAERAAADVHWHKLDVDKNARATLKGQRPAVLWFTGFSGAGKSTVANLVEKRLLALGKHTILLDGDNVRHGLNRDLGFSEADRVENIRRVAEVAKLFVEAGLIVLVSFISPYRAERMLARERVEEGEFIEVFVDTPIEECRRRDPKGLYVKADRGEIRNFTGIDAPYEVPENPEVHLRPLGIAPGDLAEQVVAELRRRELLT
ncbi:MAG: adenylyl-sulfate kinase, partial [Acetobacteraceae bacterium]|nr:adenylyl-sulfate kinase [Acetobacteraceae bacterium]